jgi:hypothetical protein
MIQSLDCIVVFKMLLAVDAKRGGLGGQLLREQVWRYQAAVAAGWLCLPMRLLSSEKDSEGSFGETGGHQKKEQMCDFPQRKTSNLQQAAYAGP